MVTLSKILKEVQLSDKIIQIALLEKDTINETMTVLYEGFFANENVCIGCDLMSNPKACKELAKLVVITAEDGASLIAVEKDTHKIIGVSFNKVQIATGNTNLDEPTFFEKFRDTNCVEKESIGVVNFMIHMDSIVDLFKTLEIDCTIEIMFLAVLPEYAGKGIGRLLVDCSISYAESIPNEKIYFNGTFPKAVTAIYTSKFSFKIGKQLGFKEILRKDFSDFNFDNKWKYSDKVDCKIHDQGVVLMYKKLKFY